MADVTHDGASVPFAWPQRDSSWDAWGEFVRQVPTEQLPRAFVHTMELPRFPAFAARLRHRLAGIARHGGTPAEQRAVEEAVKLCTAALAADGPLPRHVNHAVGFLGDVREAAAVPQLIALVPVHHADFRHQQRSVPEAVTALSRIGGTEATAALVRAAESLVSVEPDTARRCWTCPQLLIPALSRNATPAAVDAVLALTATMQVLWDEATLRAVARVADPRFVPFLLELCAGPRRAAGLAGLSRVATMRAVPALLEMLRDDRLDARTHRAVARALVAAGPGVESSLNPRSWWNRQADIRTLRALAWALGQVLSEGGRGWRPPYLAELLDHADPGVRASAAGALARVADPRAEGALIQALETDPDHRVRARAARALGRLPGTDASRAALDRAGTGDPVACVRDASRAARGPRSRSARRP
jgi:HEAT repeat protein